MRIYIERKAIQELNEVMTGKTTLTMEGARLILQVMNKDKETIKTLERENERLEKLTDYYKKDLARMSRVIEKNNL